MDSQACLSISFLFQHFTSPPILIFFLARLSNVVSPAGFPGDCAGLVTCCVVAFFLVRRSISLRKLEHESRGHTDTCPPRIHSNVDHPSADLAAVRDS
jgi:hypothetical protein